MQIETLELVVAAGFDDLDAVFDISFEKFADYDWILHVQPGHAGPGEARDSSMPWREIFDAMESPEPPWLCETCLHRRWGDRDDWPWVEYLDWFHCPDRYTITGLPHVRRRLARLFTANVPDTLAEARDKIISRVAQRIDEVVETADYEEQYASQLRAGVSSWRRNPDTLPGVTCPDTPTGTRFDVVVACSRQTVWVRGQDVPVDPVWRFAEYVSPDGNLLRVAPALLVNCQTSPAVVLDDDYTALEVAAAIDAAPDMTLVPGLICALRSA